MNVCVCTFLLCIIFILFLSYVSTASLCVGTNFLAFNALEIPVAWYNLSTEKVCVLYPYVAYIIFIHRNMRLLYVQDH